MRILVTYATKYGSTSGIAEAIADRLRAADLEVDVAPVGGVAAVSRYDAFVIGSATYVGHWLQDAATFVRRHDHVLAARPTWLFSSGPLGDQETDNKGRDLREVAEPAEIEHFRATIRPRDHVVFFGALVPHELEFRDRSIRRLPVGRELLPEGDYRDWAEVDAWSERIVSDLRGGVADDQDVVSSG